MMACESRTEPSITRPAQPRSMAAVDTQPSISQRIRELETALDTSLFLRNGPRIQPTAEAHALLAYADRVLETEIEMRERFRSRDPLRGLLRIGVSENFALICMAEMFRRLEERYPAIKASVFVGDSGMLSQQLNQRTLDLAIVSEPHVEAHVEQVPVGLSRLAWFARHDMVLPRDTLTPRELAGYHLMLAAPSARAHATVMQWFADAGAMPARVSLCNQRRGDAAGDCRRRGDRRDVDPTDEGRPRAAHRSDRADPPGTGAAPRRHLLPAQRIGAGAAGLR